MFDSFMLCPFALMHVLRPLTIMLHYHFIQCANAFQIFIREF